MSVMPGADLENVPLCTFFVVNPVFLAISVAYFSVWKEEEQQQQATG